MDHPCTTCFLYSVFMQNVVSELRDKEILAPCKLPSPGIQLLKADNVSFFLAKQVKNIVLPTTIFLPAHQQGLKTSEESSYY